MAAPDEIGFLALAAGFAAGAVLDWKPVRVISCWFLSLKLRLILSELVDVSDDIADALRDNDLLAAEGLTDFYARLCCERDSLRARIADLRRS